MTARSYNRGRLVCITLAAFVVCNVTLQAQDNTFNNATSNRDNGGDLQNQSSYTSGWILTGGSWSQINQPVLAPSDLSSRSSFDSSFWSSQNTTVIGELVSLRQELIEFRRFMLLLGGMFFAFEFLTFLHTRGTLT
jgi:hypothetical protein